MATKPDGSENARKQYPSVFVPEQLVDLPNFIAELMIKNYCLLNKQAVPNCPFWRKDIAANSANLQALAKRYGVEVSAARKLLQYYGPGVIMKYYEESKMPGFAMLKNETKGKVLLELFTRQNKAKEALIEQETVQKAAPAEPAQEVPTIWNTPVEVNESDALCDAPSVPLSAKRSKFSQL